MTPLALPRSARLNPASRRVTPNCRQMHRISFYNTLSHAGAHVEHTLTQHEAGLFFQATYECLIHLGKVQLGASLTQHEASGFSRDDMACDVIEMLQRGQRQELLFWSNEDSIKNCYFRA